MKLFKLVVSGSEDSFSIDYNSSNDFVNYNGCEYSGSEEDKYISFLEDLKKNGGPQPINIKVKMTTKSVDRAFAKNEVLNSKTVNELVNKL
ncbi:MAG: hypothetical protein AB6733_14110 [Clostridiaceae bacterium]